MMHAAAGPRWVNGMKLAAYREARARLAARSSVTFEPMHPAQQRIWDEHKRFNVVASGRRFGKTELGKRAIAAHALNGKPVAWFSPTYKMLAPVWLDFVRHFKPAMQGQNAQQHRIELTGGGVIEMWSLDSSDGPRGRKYAAAVIDEAAMVSDLDYAWTAVIRPTLADYRGEAWFLSTPRGMNFFQRAFVRGQGESRDWRSWRFSTGDNPFIDKAEIEAMRDSMPERTFMQEVEAVFLDSAGGVFRGVRETATATAQTEKVEGHQYVFGVDWAQMVDYTVITVVDITTNEAVYVDRFNKIDYEFQSERLVSLYQKFKPTTIVAEMNSIGAPVVSALQRRALPVQGFTTTNATKTQIIQDLALAIERKDLRIIPDETLMGELQAYEQERTQTGYKFGAPAGMHDDTVMSLALAWHAAKRPRLADYISIGRQ